MTSVRVVVADDLSVVRAGLRAVVAGLPGFEVVGEADNARAAACPAGEPNVVVVGDVSAPGMDSAAAIALLRAQCPAARVLALAADDGRAAALLAAGATACVPLRSSCEELARAVRAVAGVAGMMVEPARADPALSEREAEVVRLLALGYTNKEIAARLGLSVKTVETYKSRSFEKLGVRSRVGLVQYAARRGWLAVRHPAAERAEWPASPVPPQQFHPSTHPGLPGAAAAS